MILSSNTPSWVIALGIWGSIPLTMAQNFPDSVPIMSTQELQGPEFVGEPAVGHRLKPKVVFDPEVTMMHADSGNSGSTDQECPLGNNLVNSSAARTIVGDMYWGEDSTLLYGPIVQMPVVGTPRLGIATFDPDNLKHIADWYPPNSKDTMSPTYNRLRLKDSTMLIKTALGNIYTIKQYDDKGTPRLNATRAIDVSKYLLLEEEVIVAMFDANNNIWFTSGLLGQVSSKKPSSTTIGYITPDNQVHIMRIPEQVVENSFAVNGIEVFVTTGPPMNSSCSTGYAIALTANIPDKKVDVLWKATYDAGTKAKKGHFARGCGSSTSLMGHDYFAITDNADEQINLVVYHREKVPEGKDQVFCKVPLFKKGGSANDVRTTTHFDGENFAVTILNTYGSPPLMTKPAVNKTNGPINDMSEMPGGIQQVQVTSEGCKLKWTNDVRMKSVPTLSTSTGTFYGYTQDAVLAKQGQYVWYVVAIDWESGKTLWKARAGAGESHNDNFATAYLQKGRVYQSIVGGFVSFEDKRFEAAPDSYVE